MVEWRDKEESDLKQLSSKSQPFSITNKSWQYITQFRIADNLIFILHLLYILQRFINSFYFNEMKKECENATIQKNRC